MLVSTAQVQTVAFNKYRRLWDKLLAIPDRVAAMLAADQDVQKCHQILTANCASRLTMLPIQTPESCGPTIPVR